jgi:hypothetical protein
MRKLDVYPQHAQHSMHVAHAVLPLKAAHVLMQQPQLISAAVEAFHYRCARAPIRAAACLGEGGRQRTAAF